MKNFKVFTAIFFILILNSAFAGQNFEGAWWVVNSPVVSVITQLPDGRFLESDCESEQFFENKMCIKKGETTFRFFGNSKTRLCSEANGRIPFCWYMMTLSSESNTIYVKADALNTMPGVGYALTMKRLEDGVWPMKN